MKTAPQNLHKIPTGVEGLDIILDGGLVPKRMYLLTGVAGAGKTILANQICFHHITTGGRAVYVTIIEETHSQLFENLNTLSFFHHTPIGETLYYFSATAALNQQGTRGLLDFLKDILRDHRPTLLVLDSLLTSESSLQRENDLRQICTQLSALIEIHNCTLLLLSYPTTGDQLHSKTILADGVIELCVENVERRVIREVQVHKFRASKFLSGRHIFDITGDGLVVYPRTEARYTPAPSHPSKQRIRLPFDNPELDGMLHGGIMANSTTMLLGVPGSGKTALGLQFLSAGARQGQQGLYFGFYETPGYLTTKADDIGLDMSRHVEEGTIELLWNAPLENILDALAEQVFTAVRQRNVRRLFIDGLAGFEQAADFPERLNRFFSALTNELRDLQVTTLFSVEMHQLFGPIIEMPVEGISIIADNILFLRYVELHSQLFRLISILKLRDSNYESTIREFRITSNGIEVATTFESAQAILTGVATTPVSIASSRAKES